MGSVGKTRLHTLTASRDEKPTLEFALFVSCHGRLQSNNYSHLSPLYTYCQQSANTILRVQHACAEWNVEGFWTS